MAHISVLKNEVLDALTPSVSSGGIIVDGTLGAGGHTEVFAQNFPETRIIAIDKDVDAIHKAEEKLAKYKNIEFVHGSFGNIAKILRSKSIEKVDSLFLDIGFSSNQLESSGRGFSFLVEEPLLMTLGTGTQSPKETAMDLVNLKSEKEVEEIIRTYGEERHAGKIARAIVFERKHSAIVTTGRLRTIIEEAVGKFYRKSKIHPATKTFQALRIATNNELEELKIVINDGFEKLRTGGRLAIISFHSLEDRIVKFAFIDFKNKGIGKIITKKPIIPTQDEILINRRSRSAKLRVIEKI